MKKYLIVVFCSIVLMTLLVSCAPAYVDSTPEDKPTVQEIASLSGISVTKYSLPEIISFGVVTIETEYANVPCVVAYNSGNVPATFSLDCDWENASGLIDK